MLQAINLCKQEDIEQSKQIVKELASSKITPQKREKLLAELERLTGKVLSKINTEILQDLNNLGPLYRGYFLKSFNERFKMEVENRSDIERWGWVEEVINGEKKCTTLAWTKMRENTRTSRK